MNLPSDPVAGCDDATLVARTLAGERAAFAEIVRRHQTLITSLAFCAAGAVNQSEDLAQETFVTAWTRLATLEDPARLRAWLCGIVRNLARDSYRRGHRQPTQAAESLESADAVVAPELRPGEHAMSREEQAIM